MSSILRMLLVYKSNKSLVRQNDEGERAQTLTPRLLSRMKQCRTSMDLETGRKIFYATNSDDESYIFVANSLLYMYAKSSCMKEARKIFDSMPYHNVVSWNFIIDGYAQNGEHELAFQFFAYMRGECCSPNSRSFLAVLKACTNLLKAFNADKKLIQQICLQKCIVIHHEAATWLRNLDIFLTTTLIDVYSKCGSIVNAREVFDRMPCHSVVSWTALLLGYTNNGEGVLALHLFTLMYEGCLPNSRTFVAALKACASLAENEHGKAIDEEYRRRIHMQGTILHYKAAKEGYVSDSFVASTLVDMYAKCGNMVDARKVFDAMRQKNVVLWNCIITGYAESGEDKIALHLYDSMKYGNCAPDARTFVAALKACSSLAAREEAVEVDGKLVKRSCLWNGMAVHFEAAKTGCELDIFVGSTLIHMYASCWSMSDACGVFDRMPYHDIASWNCIIMGCAETGENDLALQLYARMRDEGCGIDSRTIVAALKACTNLAGKEEGKEIGGKLVKSVCLQEGMNIHFEATERNVIIESYVTSALVDFYSKCGSMENARASFDTMLRHDVVAWTALISGYADNGEGELALQLFGRMQLQGYRSNSRTFASALVACGNIGALEAGKVIHSAICRSEEKDVILATCVVDFYCKCGSMVDAQLVFDSISTKDIVAWNALIAGYSRQGDSKPAFDLFTRMHEAGLQANGSTFLSVLTACSHAGLVTRGLKCFNAMYVKYGIAPQMEHYICIIDLLGRANRMDDALVMVESMPYEPDVVTWMTLLGACQKWRNVTLGERAFLSLLRLDESQPAAYTLMANIYASVGMWQEESEVLAMQYKFNLNPY